MKYTFSKFNLFNLTLIFIYSFGVGCNTPLTPNELYKWVNDPQNNLIVKKTVGQIDYELKYIPSDLMLVNEIKKNEIGKAEYDSLIKDYSGVQYYSLKISLKDNIMDILKYNAGSEEDYYNRIQYFITDVKDNIRVVIDKDTLPCMLHHFERSYHITPYINIIFEFDDTEKTRLKSRSVIYYDKFYSDQVITFEYKEKSIKNIPHLKIN